jgi:hypothetical protein
MASKIPRCSLRALRTARGASQFAVGFGHFAGGPWRNHGFFDCFRAFPGIDVGPDEVGEGSAAFEESQVVGGRSGSWLSGAGLIAIEHTEQSSIAIHDFETEVHVEAKRGGVLLHDLHVPFDLATEFLP